MENTPQDKNVGYCSDCYIFVHCGWACTNYDAELEVPVSACFSKEKIIEPNP